MMSVAVALARAIPLHFEQDRGPARTQMRHVAAAPAHTLFLSDTGSQDALFAC
jgi:hypothetical protein